MSPLALHPNTYTWLDRLGARGNGALAVALLVTLGTIDYVTGYELSFSVFYLVPVAQCAWYVGRRTALVVAVASALVWHVANALAGESFSSSAVPVWNTLVRAGFFILFTIVLHRLRETLTALHASLAREHALSRRDALTGIANARAFVEALDTERRRALRYGHPFVIAYLDADGFKAVNDSLGHGTGDDVLRTIGETLSHSVRSTDLVARLGGDEFGLLLPETGEEGARRLLEKLRTELSARLARDGWDITFSVGAVYATPTMPILRELSVEELVRLADALMYTVKRSGKDAVSLHPASVDLAALVPARVTPVDSPAARER